MRKDGDSGVITPIKTNRLLEMLARWEPLEEDFPELEDQPPQSRELF